MKLAAGIAYLTSDELRRVDEAAINEYGIDVLSLMENAGRQTALLAKTILNGKAAGRRVTILVGKGNNGGDGLVAARHLHNWGADVGLALGSTRDELGVVPAEHLAALEKMGLSATVGGARLAGSDLLVDALLGYNSRGAPRGPVADLVRLANLSRVPILALDLPSGLDPTSGVPNEPCIAAKATITLGFPKQGFLNRSSRPYVGDLYLCDISLPREVYADYAGMSHVFESDSIVRVALD